MTILTKIFHRWVSAFCLSMTGPTVAQLVFSLAVTVFELRAHFFVTSVMLIEFVVSLYKSEDIHASLVNFVISEQQNLELVLGQ